MGNIYIKLLLDRFDCELDSRSQLQMEGFRHQLRKGDTIFNRQGFVASLSWKRNPLDLLTRAISADSLMNCDKWWNGPSFLHEENTVPVSNNVLLSDESAYLEELKPSERKTLTETLDNNFLNKILSVYNNFQKFLCVCSYICRFIYNCKKPSNKQIVPVKISEIQRTEITLVKLVQKMEFNSEIKYLSSKGMVNPQ
ncbi:integrase_H2C2 domain-containing protein, partial [Trichonephila clavata]